MKIPLKCQSTEFECVPTTFLNALNYLLAKAVQQVWHANLFYNGLSCLQ